MTEVPRVDLSSFGIFMHVRRECGRGGGGGGGGVE